MTDELLELRALAPEVAAPSESTTAAARAALVAAFAAEHDGPTHSAATSPRRLPGRRVRRPVRWTLLAASVLATVVVVGVVSTSGRGGADPAAAAALGRLAVVAAAQPPFALRAGQYLYVRSSSDYGGSYDSCQLHTPDRTEIWVSANESGLQRDTILTPSLFYSGQAGECAHALRAARSTVGTGATAFAPGCLSLGPPDLARLPTNPAALAPSWWPARSRAVLPVRSRTSSRLGTRSARRTLRRRCARRSTGSPAPCRVSSCSATYATAAGGKASVSRSTIPLAGSATS